MSPRDVLGDQLGHRVGGVEGHPVALLAGPQGSEGEQLGEVPTARADEEHATGEVSKCVHVRPPVLVVSLVSLC